MNKPSRPARKKGPSKGTGGNGRRALEGKGPTPKAEDRPYHAAHRSKRSATSTQRPRSGPPPRTGRPGSGPEWVAGRNAVLEAMEAGIPTKTAYVAEGAERDDRLRDIFKLAAGKGTPLLEVTRVELDRLTEIGLVESTGLAASRGGRRSAIVALSSGMRFVGIDIGATSVDVAVTDGELRVLSQVSEPVDVRKGPDVVLAVALELVGKLRAEGVAVDIHGAGVGVPGPVSFRDGVPVAPPIRMMA